MDKPADVEDSIDEAPPFLRTWRRVYTGVLIYLAAIIGLLYGFTRWFAQPK